MTRTQIVVVATAMALAVPLGSAMAQTRACGVETWSTDKMAYVNVPCTAGETSAGGTVGAAAPSVQGSNSTTITKQEMKQGTYYPAPMQTQAVTAGPSYASMGDSCGPSRTVALTDEYGHKYNCRGDRIR